MRRHTTDPAERAADIANREADRKSKEEMEASYQESCPSYRIIWLWFYNAALREFQPLPEPLFRIGGSFFYIYLMIY